MTLQEFKKSAKDGKIFTVTFTKKNGEKRVMNARLGVKKHLRGGELKFDAEGRNLLPVFDVQKRGYRMINFNTVEKIVMNGKTVLVK